MLPVVTVKAKLEGSEEEIRRLKTGIRSENTKVAALVSASFRLRVHLNLETWGQWVENAPVDISEAPCTAASELLTRRKILGNPRRARPRRSYPRRKQSAMS